MADEGVGEEATAETKLHHHPSMPDANDHFGLLSDPFLLTVFNMVADGKSLMNVCLFHFIFLGESLPTPLLVSVLTPTQSS
ncbi:hypothetical protein QJS04_geneDACA008237 [Acorus gramineus]|uniref:Uncharacterized protein n=1 Tax=Acorus gramineus TaxID=55184 RepID=A0AAV9AYJ4_ACOGR|nr:hypothetical protein QJS04_geneDACA008237 [Acorus gramineus]